IHPADDLAEHGVLVVEPRRLVESDEELRAAGIRTRIGHRQYARAVVSKLRVELVLDLVAGAARSSTLRAAALNHEAGDHAVKREPVEVSLLDEVDEVLRGHRRTILEQLDAEVALCRAELRSAVRHESSRQKSMVRPAWKR